MADDLTIVASILRDTNKKLDILHADKVQDDGPSDIIKAALPSILADNYNTTRNINSIKTAQKDEDKNDGDQMAADKVAAKSTLEVLNEIVNLPALTYDPVKLLSDQTTLNAVTLREVSEASEAQAQTLLDALQFRNLQSTDDRALTLLEGFKIGGGDFFKELGGGIKNIGRGIKFLGTKGLTAAQRKIEEKRKENKEKNKDSLLKTALGSITGFLGGIFKTAKLGLKATGLALLGAGALYALAKLIESPFFLKAAGTIEFALQKLINFISLLGPGGTLALALALYIGPDAAIKAASAAIGLLAGPLGPFIVLAAAAGALYFALDKLFGWMSARNREAEFKRVAEIMDSDKAADKKLAALDAIAKRYESVGGAALSDDNKAILKEIENQRKELRKELGVAAAPPEGGTPKQLLASIAEQFETGIAKISFTEGSDAAARTAKIRDSLVLSRDNLLDSTAYKTLDLSGQKEFLERVGRQFTRSLNAADKLAKKGLAADERENMIKNISELGNVGGGKIEELLKVNAEATELARENQRIVAQLAISSDAIANMVLNNSGFGEASNRPGGDVIPNTPNIVQTNVVDAKNNITIPVTAPLVLNSPTGQAASYGGGMM